MQQPRLGTNDALISDEDFADALSDAMSEAGAHGLDARLVQLQGGCGDATQRARLLLTRSRAARGAAAREDGATR